MPFGEIGQAGQGTCHSFPAHQPVGDTRCQRPDRLDPGHLGRAVDGQHVVGMRQGQLFGEALQLAGDDERGAQRHLAEAGLMEQHDIGEAGTIGDDDAPGLGTAARRLMPHDLHLERDDAAGLRLREAWPLPPIDIAVGQVEQQVADRGAAHQPGERGRQARAYAGQEGQGRANFCEEIHGQWLTPGLCVTIGRITHERSRSRS